MAPENEEQRWAYVAVAPTGVKGDGTITFIPALTTENHSAPEITGHLIAGRLYSDTKGETDGVRIPTPAAAPAAYAAVPNTPITPAVHPIKTFTATPGQNIILDETPTLNAKNGDPQTTETFSRNTWKYGAAPPPPPATDKTGLTREEALRLLKVTEAGDGTATITIGENTNG